MHRIRGEFLGRHEQISSAKAKLSHINSLVRATNSLKWERRAWRTRKGSLAALIVSHVKICSSLTYRLHCRRLRVFRGLPRQRRVSKRRVSSFICYFAFYFHTLRSPVLQ